MTAIHSLYSLVLSPIQHVSSDRLQRAVTALAEGTLAITLTRQAETEMRALVKNGEGIEYGVTLTHALSTCSCKDSLYRGVVCKHAVAVALYVLRTPPPEQDAPGELACHLLWRNGQVVCGEAQPARCWVYPWTDTMLSWPEACPACVEPTSSPRRHERQHKTFNVGGAGPLCLSLCGKRRLKKGELSMSRQHTYGMGQIYRRGRLWWIRYYGNGELFRESSHSEKEAEAKKLLKRRLGEIALGRFAGPQADKVTLAELADDLLTDYQIRGRKNQKQVKSKVNHLLAYFGKDRAKRVTTDRVKAYIAKRQEAGAAAAQINRELAALKRMFSLAVHAEKLPSAPYIPTLTEHNVRTGFFEYEEFRALREALPPFLRPVVTFGYYTGWRVTEVLTLQWRQVDLNAAEVRLDPGTTKNGKGDLPGWGAARHHEGATGVRARSSA